MKFNESKKIMPESTHNLINEIFCVSNGKDFALARWANLADEHPEGGYDFDEFDFKPYGCYVEPLFWAGPIAGSDIWKV